MNEHTLAIIFLAVWGCAGVVTAVAEHSGDIGWRPAWYKAMSIVVEICAVVLAVWILI